MAAGEDPAEAGGAAVVAVPEWVAALACVAAAVVVEAGVLRVSCPAMNSACFCCRWSMMSSATAMS